MIKVAVVPERYGHVFSPCGSIRLSAFFDEIRKQRGELEVRYLLLSELKRYRPDVVIWQRTALPTTRQVEQLTNFATAAGIHLIYDLDDNLLDVTGHGEAAAYATTLAAVTMSLAVADEVWVSTKNLAERISTTTKASILVLPNALDPGLWGSGPLQECKMRTKFCMLYMGTRTHDEDFRLLDAGLQILNRLRPGSFELTMIGVSAGEVSNQPWLRTLNPPRYVGASYPAFVHWFSRLNGFDLGLAPLLSGRFNDCKSCIKVLDYAALGIPSLASDVAPYREGLKDETNVFLVKNTPEAWADRISALMSASDLLFQTGRKARELVSMEAFLQAVDIRKARILQLSSKHAHR